MTEQDLELIKQYQLWRRDNDGIHEMPNPTEIGKALDKIIAFCELVMKLDEND